MSIKSMSIKSMHHVGMTVTDLAAAVAFFEELGMELEGKAHMEGEFVDGVIGLDGSVSEIAMMKTPDGRYRVENYNGMLKTCYVRGPEGMLIELCEYLT